MFEVESAPRAAPGAPEQAAEIPTEPGAAGVGRDFAVTALGQLGVAVGGLVLYRLLARDQGASALGSYALVKQVTLFLFPATMLGLQIGVPRYVALDRDQEEASERYLLAGMSVTALAIVVIGTVLLISPHTTADVFFGNRDRASLVFPLVATLAATVVFEAVYGYYRGRSEFKLASAARVWGVAALPVVLVLAAPHEPIGHLITWMAVGLVATCAVIAARPLAAAFAAISVEKTITAIRTLLDYGRRRIPGEYASVLLMALPAVIASHAASLNEVAYLTTGIYVLSVLTIAFQPIGLVFLPLLSRLCREDFQAARRSVATLATCALHLAVFTTPQLLLFADVAVRAWLGHRFDAAAPVIRLTVLPTAAYLFYLILRSTLDAAAVKGYNSRNNVIALASAAIAVTAFLGIGVGKPVESIAGAFAFGIAVLGTLTLATVHSVYRLERRSYALAASLALGLVTAGIGVVVRLALVGSSSSTWTIMGVVALEVVLAVLYLVGLSRAGVAWPAEVGHRLRRRPA